MQAVALTSRSLSDKVFFTLFFCCLFLPFLPSWTLSCFSPNKFFLLPASCFLHFDLFLQDFIAFHFLILFSSFIFPLDFRCPLRLWTASLLTIQCISSSGPFSFDETTSLISPLWGCSDANIRIGRSQRRNSCNGSATAHRCFILTSQDGNLLLDGLGETRFDLLWSRPYVWLVLLFKQYCRWDSCVINLTCLDVPFVARFTSFDYLWSRPHVLHDKWQLESVESRLRKQNWIFCRTFLHYISLKS